MGYLISKLLENDILNFVYDGLNPDTGELDTRNRDGSTKTPHRYAYFRGLMFKVYDPTEKNPEGLVTLAGSLHYYFNGGLHNHNDFTSNDMRGVILDLKQKFNIDLTKATIQRIEIGVNITPPIKTGDILQHCIMHKTESFDKEKFNRKGNLKQSLHSDYGIKIYDKALQNIKKGLIKSGTEIMRLEKNYIKMRQVNAKGIYTLHDLIHFDMALFKPDILKEWDNVLFYDPTINCKKEYSKKYRDPNTWKELLKRDSHSAFKKHRTKLRKLIRDNSENIHGKIKELIDQKIDQLNTQGYPNTPFMYTVKTVTPPTKEQCIKSRRCIVTGMDISMQDSETFLLGTKGLYYYYKNEYRIFEQVKRKYLNGVWGDAELKIQIKEIYHNIRNHNSNQKIKQARLYQPYQLNLLNGLGCVRPSN